MLGKLFRFKTRDNRKMQLLLSIAFPLHAFEGWVSSADMRTSGSNELAKASVLFCVEHLALRAIFRAQKQHP